MHFSLFPVRICLLPYVHMHSSFPDIFVLVSCHSWTLPNCVPIVFVRSMRTRWESVWNSKNAKIEFRSANMCSRMKCVCSFRWLASSGYTKPNGQTVSTNKPLFFFFRFLSTVFGSQKQKHASCQRQVQRNLYSIRLNSLQPSYTTKISATLWPLSFNAWSVFTLSAR